MLLLRFAFYRIAKGYEMCEANCSGVLHKILAHNLRFLTQNSSKTTFTAKRSLVLAPKFIMHAKQTSVWHG